MKKSVQIGLLTILTLMTGVCTSEMVPFVIPAKVNPDSAIAMHCRPLEEKDRLHAETHFVNEAGQPVRMWGVNLSFGASFPTHDDAEQIAARMAAFGVNSVRCHHMDTDTWPRGIWDASGKDLHPEALDRLDYFINQLAAHGIYTNLNLHVGKKYSAAPDIPASPTDYDKMVNIFTPKLIELQKIYARKLLTHKNPYRNNVPYAEDYAVAIVEITNENSLFMWSAENTLRTLPEYYANLLAEQYNSWLKNKYTTQASLEKAWLGQSVPMGETILKNSTLTDPTQNTDSWVLEQHNDCKAVAKQMAYNGKRGLGINPSKSDGTSWHLQLNQRELTLKKGTVYTIEFDAAAPALRSLNVGVGQAHEPWENLGLYQTFTLTPEWKTYRASFTATDDDTNARLNFSFGDDSKPFYLANVTFCPGVQYTLDAGESLVDGTVKLFGEVESQQRKIDRMLFLADTEKRYFDGMRNFIKHDLNSRAMVTGTIVFGPLGLYAQSDMDFIDSHAYWQHPRFPNRPWDSGDWTVDQKPMSDNPPGTLLELASERLAGKPYTVTEYNHPAPLDSQAECVPMIASFAAAQDWDGVWLYTYTHSNDSWDREYMNSYFDIDTNPAKWGFMPAGAVMFRDDEILPFRNQAVRTIDDTHQKMLDALADFQIKHDRNLAASISAAEKEKLDTAFSLALAQTPAAQAVRTGGRLSAKAHLQWDVVNNRGLYVLRNDRCYVVTGNTERFKDVANGLSLAIQQPGFAAVTVTAMDDKPMTDSNRILITACGRCENTGMQFSEDRRTVGRNWGQAPVEIEPVEGTITLPKRLNNTPMTCKVLNPDGTVKQQFTVTNNTIALKAEYGTMWYLVERE